MEAFARIPTATCCRSTVCVVAVCLMVLVGLPSESGAWHLYAYRQKENLERLFSPSATAAQAVITEILEQRVSSSRVVSTPASSSDERYKVKTAPRQPTVRPKIQVQVVLK